MNFIIVGAQKAGTTALASFLDGHPEICMADEKELHVFDHEEYSPDWTAAAIDERYSRAFSRYAGQRRLGEATPIYLYWPHIAGQLSRYNPEMRLIVLVRDPVERAISHHRMERARGNEWLPLLPALLAESYRLRRDRRHNTAQDSSWRRHSYVDRGRYARQLENLFRSFRREQVLILKTESLWDEHTATLRRVYAFLDVAADTHLPPPRAVFAGQPDRRRLRLARAFLEARLGGESARLRALIPEIGIDW